MSSWWSYKKEMRCLFFVFVFCYWLFFSSKEHPLPSPL